jgi:DNA-binding HxlR family transcriptional regulator
MGASYHQFCPVAKAMELLDERWTMLIVRELVSGSQRFNELRRGLPRMSPSLLSVRLQQLTRAGLVERSGGERDVSYRLTPAGRELQPIVEALGAWGIRWIGELGDADLDPQLLLWDMHRNLNAAAVPAGRTVLHFEFPDAPPPTRHWWLVITAAGTGVVRPPEADVCDRDPGYPVTVSIVGDLRTMTSIWRGDTTWTSALRAGSVEIQGPRDLRRAVPDWFALSRFAATPRPAAGTRPPVPARA